MVRMIRVITFRVRMAAVIWRGILVVRFQVFAMVDQLVLNLIWQFAVSMMIADRAIRVGVFVGQSFARRAPDCSSL